MTSTNRILLLATVAACLPAAAHAQSAPAASAEPAQSVADTVPANQIEDIVVTAQRREQRGNDVGIAMNVLSGADLARAGVKQVVDLASQTPNVQIKNVLGNSVPNVTIRGIGLNDYASNNNPAAGIYVDNVYLVSPAMLSFGLFDIDRVEVLKGPQGDLYGRNTTAGAINIISNRPSAVTDVRMQAGYGSYRNWHFNGAVGGALTSTLNGRFAVTTEHQDSGWQRNYVTGKRVGKVDRTAARLQLAWAPVESLSVRLSAHAGYDRSDESLYKVDNVTTTEEDQYVNRPRVAGASNDPHLDNKAFGASLTVDYALGDALTLTSISAYEKFERFDESDQDGTSLHQLDSIFRNTIEQQSQELRLAYSRDTLNLIGGVYYSHDTVSDRDSYGIIDLLPSFGDTLGNTYHQKTNAYAGFLHGEWTFVPKLTLVAGLRFTHERKLFDNVTTFFGSNGVYTTAFPAVSSRYSTSRLSGKVGLNYKLADDTLIYANVSRGVKSGGFQGQLTFDPTVIQPFRDETVTAYEVGIKSRVLPNLQINTAAFDYEYEHAQFYGPLFDSPVGVLFGITNVGDARVRGFEGDALWRPTTGLDLHFGVGVIDTKITRSIVAGVAEGSRLPNAPKLTLNGSIKYGWTMSGDLAADITLSGNYQSRLAFDIVRNPSEALEGGYFLANGEAGADIGDHFRLSVYARNLFDKRYRTQALFTSVGWSYQYGAPRTVGVNLSYKL
ncbi:TonB-dependent receptor [Hephaestia sp. GCM10023244]